MPCRHNGAVVLVVKRGTAKVHHADCCVLHCPLLSFLEGRRRWGIKCTGQKLTTDLQSSPSSHISPSQHWRTLWSRSWQKGCSRVSGPCESACCRGELERRKTNSIFNSSSLTRSALKTEKNKTKQKTYEDTKSRRCVTRKFDTTISCFSCNAWLCPIYSTALWHYGAPMWLNASCLQRGLQVHMSSMSLLIRSIWPIATRWELSL